jgi:DNA-binding SARP family transcriptional activator
LLANGVQAEAPARQLGEPSRGHRSEASAARLSLLNGFELKVGGSTVPLAFSSQHLLAYLAVINRRVSRSTVAGTLWGGVPDSRAAGNLRSALWRLRHVDVGLVGSYGDNLMLAPTLSVDIYEADRIARLAFDPTTDVSCLSVEELPITGELLPGWDYEWVMLERERLRQISLHVLDALCHRWTRERSFDKAIKAGLAAVASEPLRETSQCALISAFIAEGNPSEAIRRFTLYAELLGRELKLSPSLQLVKLMSDLGAR